MLLSNQIHNSVPLELLLFSRLPDKLYLPTTTVILAFDCGLMAQWVDKHIRCMRISVTINLRLPYSRDILTSCTVTYELDECRALWGEPEQVVCQGQLHMRSLYTRVPSC